MQIHARHMNARIAPRKIRPLGDIIIGLPVKEAEHQLMWRPDKAASLVKDVLASAVANASHNHDIPEGNLKVAALLVDQGFRFKRFQPVSRGSGHPFVKQTCHIRVVIEEIEEQAVVRPGKKTEIETIDVEEFVKGEEPTEDVEEPTRDKRPEVTDEEAHPDATVGASNKIRMQQKGGNKKKQHRRKAI